MLRKAEELFRRGCVFALTGRAADAVQMITSGVTAWRSTGSTVWTPLHMSFLANAYARLGQFDDAWRCIGEAMTASGDNQGNVVRSRYSSHGRGNRAAVGRARRGESGSVFRTCARGCAQAAGKVVRTACGDEHGAAMARSGQKATRPAIFSPRSMAGSPRVSTRST